MASSGHFFVLDPNKLWEITLQSDCKIRDYMLIFSTEEPLKFHVGDPKPTLSEDRTKEKNHVGDPKPTLSEDKTKEKFHVGDLKLTLFEDKTKEKFHVGDPKMTLSEDKTKEKFHVGDPKLTLSEDKTKGFWVDEETGKICYVLGSKSLKIIWGDNNNYWTWITDPSSRFPTVAKIKMVWWFDIEGDLKSDLLSKNTNYAGYLVYKEGAQHLHLSVSVTFSHQNNEGYVNLVNGTDRPNGWKEIKLGLFHTGDQLDTNEVKVKLWNHKDMKTGLIVEGIEFRPY